MGEGSASNGHWPHGCGRAQAQRVWDRRRQTPASKVETETSMQERRDGRGGGDAVGKRTRATCGRSVRGEGKGGSDGGRGGGTINAIGAEVVQHPAQMKAGVERRHAIVVVGRKRQATKERAHAKGRGGCAKERGCRDMGGAERQWGNRACGCAAACHTGGRRRRVE